MSIAHLDTIAESILELLRERHRVVIPDFGAFTGIYESAEVDRAGKTLSPPTLRIDFQRELRSNDGSLIAHLIERHGWPPEEAERRLAAFVEEAEKQLARRQMISFPGLGKLYIDFDKNYKFIQESGNLNKATFGLPDVPLAPLPADPDMPSEALAAEDGGQPIEVNDEATQPQEQALPKAGNLSSASLRQTQANKASGTSWLNSSTPWVILMLLIILLVSGYFLWKKFTGKHNSTSPQTEETAAGPHGGLAQKSSPADFDKLSPADFDKLSPEDDELLFEDDAEDLADLQYEEEQAAEETAAMQEEGEEPPSTPDDSEAPTLPPDVQEGIIIIGSFTQPKNAERLIQRLYEDGYDAYSDRRGGRTRVGIRFTYRGEAELMDYLEQMKNKYNVDAWVLE